MAAGEIMLAVKFGVIGGVVLADKISVRTIVCQAAADNLFYLTLVEVDTGTKRGQKG